MDPKRCSFGKSLSTLSAMVVAVAIVPGDTLLSTPSPLPSQSSAQAPKIPPDQLDSLVAPIALYPDPLLAQTLAASTYPLELIQLQQWLLKNPGLKDQALADAVAKQPWDPSIQALAGLPDVVKRLADDIQWTTDLGNAFTSAATATILGVGTAHRNNPVAVALEQAVETPVGGTIRNIAAARHIATVLPQTGLAAQREATRLLTVRLVPGNSLAVKAAIWQAIGPATDG